MKGEPEETKRRIELIPTSKSYQYYVHIIWYYITRQQNCVCACDIQCTVLNLILRMEKNNFNFKKHVFLVKVVNHSIYKRYENS